MSSLGRARAILRQWREAHTGTLRPGRSPAHTPTVAETGAPVSAQLLAPLASPGLAAGAGPCA